VIAAALWDDIEKPNQTYSRLVEGLLPPAFRGLVLAALLAALMSSISSMFNSASTLVARDLVARFRPGSSARTQILVGQGALLAVMVGGILVVPLIDLYEHVWDYLQEVTGYLSVPFAVVGLCGIFTRRANRAGAVAAVGAGLASGIFLFADSHKAGGLWDALRHPYLRSFLHRSFLCAVVSFAALWVVSLLTRPPREEVLRGSFTFSWSRGEGESPRDLRLAGAWIVALFVAVAALWWTFR
jgi:SSS family solute:Na+ symporter